MPATASFPGPLIPPARAFYTSPLSSLIAMQNSQKETKTQKFIEIMKKFPVLYDTRDPNYKHKLYKQRAWMNVSKLTGENIASMRSKWKNLRDSYIKHLRVQDPLCEGFQTHKKYLHWPWAPRMEFMRPILEGVSKQSRTYSSCRSPSPEKPKTPIEIQIKTEDTTESTDEVEEPNPVPQGLQGCPEWMQEYDGTDLIFLGYSNIVKKMSAIRQASTRFKIAQIVMEAELEQIHEDR